MQVLELQNPLDEIVEGQAEKNFPSPLWSDNGIVSTDELHCVGN